MYYGLTMVVLILNKAPSGLKGEISNWLIELQSGVFVGNLSSVVRQQVWQRVCFVADGKDMSATLVYRDPKCSQKYSIMMVGDTQRTLKDCDGLVLVQKAKIKTKKD